MQQSLVANLLYCALSYINNGHAVFGCMFGRGQKETLVCEGINPPGYFENHSNHSF